MSGKTPMVTSSLLTLFREHIFCFGFQSMLLHAPLASHAALHSAKELEGTSSTSLSGSLTSWIMSDQVQSPFASEGEKKAYSKK